MRWDGGENTQFLIFGKRNFKAWRTDSPDRIESLEEISIHAQAIWRRKSPVSGAIDGKIEQILPVGQIGDAQRFSHGLDPLQKSGRAETALSYVAAPVDSRERSETDERNRSLDLSRLGDAEVAKFRDFAGKALAVPHTAPAPFVKDTNVDQRLGADV